MEPLPARTSFLAKKNATRTRRRVEAARLRCHFMPTRRLSTFGKIKRIPATEGEVGLAGLSRFLLGWVSVGDF